MKFRSGRTPREVLSVINHRVIHRKHVVAAVSGGVSFQRSDLYGKGFKSGSHRIEGIAQPRQASPAPSSSWWWD